MLAEYVERYDLVLAFGAAGSGKTHAASMLSADALDSVKTSKLILIRPAVSAQEELGYLPGTADEKVQPFLYPILDAFKDIWPDDKVIQMRKEGLIEFWPIAFMRGRTVRNAWCVVDEAQNLTLEGWYLLLTRLGEDAKMIITGDWQQSDLSRDQASAQRFVEGYLSRSDKVGMVRFPPEDNLRHPVVEDVIRTYAEYRGQHAHAA